MFSIYRDGYLGIVDMSSSLLKDIVYKQSKAMQDITNELVTRLKGISAHDFETSVFDICWENVVRPTQKIDEESSYVSLSHVVGITYKDTSIDRVSVNTLSFNKNADGSATLFVDRSELTLQDLAEKMTWKNVKIYTLSEFNLAMVGITSMVSEVMGAQPYPAKQQ